MKLVFFFLLTLALVACGTSNLATGESVDAPTPADESSTSEHQIIFEDVAPGDSLFAFIRKSACFGTCPVYTMSIYNSGYVVFNGMQHVDMKGIHTGQLTVEQMLVFIDKANEIGYFDMKDEYDNKGVTDLPSATTSLVMNGDRKQIRRRYDYPRELLSFEKLFEDLFTTLTWEGPSGSIDR